MKKNWLRKISAALCAATLFTSGFAMTANAAGETIAPFKWEDYKNLVSPDLSIEDADDLYGEVEITKKIANPSQDDFTQDDTIPVNGVEFTMTKVGDYAVVEDANGNPSVMIGIHEDVLTAIGYTDPQGSTPIKDKTGYVYLTSDVYNSLNENYLFVDDKDNLQFNISDFDDKIDDFEEEKKVTPIVEKTGEDETKSEDGVAKFHSVPFGIYVVRETNVYNAVADVNGDNTKENVYFSKKQHPYLISVPASVEVNGTKKWTDNIEVNAKNDTEPVDLDKLIVRNSNNLSKEPGTNETDVTHIGDTVEFQLKTEVPALDPTQPGDVIDTYVINDVISKGLKLYDLGDPKNIFVKDSAGTEYVLGDDYTVSVDGKVYDGDSEQLISDDSYTTGGYAGGTSFTITFTKDGLKKLTALAKNGSYENYILVNYVAKVNSDAVVGQVGNPNKVQLVYSAAGSHDIETGWEEVIEFIFEMEGTKYFDGKAIDPTQLNVEDNPNASVVFELYQSTNGGPKTLVKFTEVKDIDGNVTGYLYNPEGTVTSIKPSANGKFHITGLPVFNESSDTFYLRETATAAGYNKITKDIEIKLVAANKTETGETDEYTGLLSTTSCTVNRKTPGYNDTATGITFTVNNTSGFQLPSTGGMGIWMFVIGGMAVIGCGLRYYRKNAKSAK